MSKTVHKHCNIINYIRQVDTDLYDLVQDLCIGRIFVPRRGAPGLTFLRPDKELLSKIKKLAGGDNPEEAVAALQSLVLLDYLPSTEVFEDKKSDIPTFLRKKLEVASADGKKVVLKNGAELVLDSKFEARNDRSNIAVYIISKSLVPTDGEPANFSNASAGNKKVKGGAEYSGKSKADLFRLVLDACCDCSCSSSSKRDPALEILVSLMRYLEKNSHKENLSTVKSQLSSDTLTTLAIVLQPFRTDSTGVEYIPSSIYNDWVNKYGNSRLKDITSFCYVDNPVAYYVSAMNSAKEEYKELAASINKTREPMLDKVSKVSAVQQLNDFYTNSPIKGPGLRSSMQSKQAIAESELRVMGALLNEKTDGGTLDKDEALQVYEKTCKLDRPYMCSDKELISGSNLGFYFSSIYLIVRSDALLYVPGVCDHCDDLKCIADEDKNISLDKSIVPSLAHKECYDAKYNEQLKAFRALLTDL